MTPTLDDLRMTFEEAYSKANFSTHSNNVLEGLRAVIETHFVPMLVEAASQFCQYSDAELIEREFLTPSDYADRIKLLILEPRE